MEGCFITPFEHALHEMFSEHVQGEVICFNRTETDDDGNPPESRCLTSITAFIMLCLLFYWLVSILWNEYKPGTMPNPIPLTNTPFMMRVYGAAQTTGTLLCMFLWRRYNLEPCYIAYLSSLTVAQCYWILFHLFNTNLLNDQKKPALAISMVVVTFFVTLAHGSPAIWEGPQSWMKWLVYDLLWFFVIYLVYLNTSYKRTLLDSAEFRSLVIRLTAAVILSYVGWCAACWWKSGQGVFYSIWIFFLTLLFVAYAQLNDFLAQNAMAKGKERNE